jgi:hypothetical protein
VEECTYFWGVNTSWGINMVESKRPINQEDNQAPQPTGWSPKVASASKSRHKKVGWNSYFELMDLNK